MNRFSSLIALAVLFVSPPRTLFAQADTVAAKAPATAEAAPAAEADKTPYFTWGNRKVHVGLDFAFVSYKDRALAGSMGRERQMTPSRLVVSLYGDFNDTVAFRVEMNPLDRSVRPRPYIPSVDDRRTYFFPNQPDQPGSRGVSSVPEGLYNVDDYKSLGTDPILSMGGLRIGYVDLHAKSKRLGMLVGRFYVPQGLGLDNVTWFSAKDLVHMQAIDAAADNGVQFYYDHPKLRVELAGVTGNGSPFHDYGYYDFTYSEDKNSAVATVARGTFMPFKGFMVGGSVKHNYVNSRIEDSTTLQLSKRYDNAFTVFSRWEQSRYLTVFGEVTRYKWGQRDSSADLMAGVRPHTPLFKDGYYLGAEGTTPEVFSKARFVLTYVRSELDRDDSLVSWAAANSLFGATLGKREWSNVAKVQARFGENISLFWFMHRLGNPFPELSAIRPVSGPGADLPYSSDKSGMGVAFRF